MLVLNCEIHKKVFIYVYLQFKRKLFGFDITENPFNIIDEFAYINPSTLFITISYISRMNRTK